MEEISSVENRQIKRLVLLRDRARERRKAKSFLIEGERLVLDAPVDRLEEVYMTRAVFEEMGGRFEGVRSAVISDAVMRKISDTQTPQGILAVVREPEWELSDIAGKEHPMLLLLENIQDPGNLGTMFRTAEAAGAAGIVMNRGCVDVFNPKVVRSTMSSIFREPFLVTDDLCDFIAELRERITGIHICAAYLDPSSRQYDAVDYRGACAFLVGNEGNGLSVEAVNAADETIYIPMCGKIESLNAAMSAGILMYEAARQRREDFRK